MHGKINAPLSLYLENAEWGEHSFSELFDRIEQGRRLKKLDQLPGDIPFVMAGITNTGVVNYVSNPVAIFPKNSITIDIFGNTFYRNYIFGAGDDTGVYWNENKTYSREVMLFLASAMEKSLMGKFSYGKKLRSSQSLHFTMRLPEKNGQIDFEFMEKFIAELEAERVSELEAERVSELSAYLKISGLDNYELTEEETTAINNYHKIEWGIFNLEKLYGKSTRGKRLKSADRIPGDLPFVTAGEAEEGISDFIGNNVQVFSRNTTTIDMFGSAKYRNYDYGADDHIAVVHTEELPMNAAIFVTSAIHKSSHNGQFDYGKNFYAKDADVLDISLPAKNGQPDYDMMRLIVSAIHKLVIKDVDIYAEQKVNAAKTVVSS